MLAQLLITQFVVFKELAFVLSHLILSATQRQTCTIIFMSLEKLTHIDRSDWVSKTTEDWSFHSRNVSNLKGTKADTKHFFQIADICNSHSEYISVLPACALCYLICLVYLYGVQNLGVGDTVDCIEDKRKSAWWMWSKTKL